MLGDRDERDAVPLEGLHHAGEIQQRPAQPVHFVDHHAVDAARLDVDQPPPHRRPVHVAARKAPVVIQLRQADAAFVLLAGDVGLGRFPLGVERVELLLQSLFGRLSPTQNDSEGRLFSKWNGKKGAFYFLTK